MKSAIVILIFLAVFPGIRVFSQQRPNSGTVWFSPDNDTEDYLDLFTKPELWAKSRSRIQVFKFGPQQVKENGQPPINSFNDLVKVDAFRKLRAWGIDIAIEAPAIKEWDCTAIKARQMTIGYIKTVHKAGGSVRYIAIDEPLASGPSKCSLNYDDVVERTAAYIRLLSTDTSLASINSIPEVGDIEAYPATSAQDLERWIKSLEAKGAKPRFFHLDVNVHRLDVSPEIDYRRDLRELKRFFQSENIPFGVIFWPGYNPENSEKDYYDRTMTWVKKVHQAIGRPDQAIFQSWILRTGGNKSIPVNLPENAPSIYSHTKLINDGLQVLN